MYKFEKPSKVDFRTDKSVNIGMEVNDLISRADALEQMAQAECGLHYDDCEADNCSCSYIKRILDIPSANAESDDLIIKGAKGIKDGLYNIKDGKLFMYKANGGTVRTYPIVPSANYITELPNDVVESQDDVIKVVFCKDCQYRFYDKYNDCFMCEKHEYGESFEDDDYCSWGERTKKCSKDAHDADLYGLKREQ